ncbi:MAG: hypothetical protein MUC85_12150, partial [Anaerolineales bacterium]|nr:hypothetical protein [Anaerolineales bacterium]
MDNQPTENQSNGNSSQPEAFESRRERRAARRGGEGAWIIGVVLVILGIVFLLQNMGAVNLKNWW